MRTTADLAHDLRGFIQQAGDAMWLRFCPQGRLPRFIAGEKTFVGTRSALLALLPELLAVGIERLGGTELRGLIAQELARVRAADCRTWWTLFVP
jgi:hypothetical protein